MASKKIVLLFLIFLVSYFSFSQCPSGEVLLYDQSDVEKFIEDYGFCEVIEGDLVIGSEVTDISGITFIKRIEGSLILNYANVPEISNFASLEYIGGDFRIEFCYNLIVVEGLNKLHTVGGDFLIMGNYTELMAIKGFNALETIGGNFQISENYHALQKIEAFDNLVHVGGWFTIRNNGLLTALTGFNKLKKIGTQFDVSSFKGNLLIEKNPLLTEITGFNALTAVERNLEILGNPSLKRIEGFNNLTNVRYLTIRDCPDLAEISKFEELTTVEGMEISQTGLTVIDGFNNVRVIGEINPSWGNLYILQNDNLTTISGFRNLTELKGEIGITRNAALKSLIGFSNLIRTRGINIQVNESLEDLHGFEKLFTVGIIDGRGISIAQNESLSDCSAICNLLNNGNVYGTIFIGYNLAGCNSEEEVREICIPDFDDDGILDDDDLDDDNDGILDVVEQDGNVDRDTDGDGYPDHMDLDSDGDGCFDVQEAGFTDEDANGTLGTSPDDVDENGLITGASDGYSTPLDTNGNEIFDFQENNTLSAGEDAVLKICIDSNPVNLFEELEGNPDLGGSWSPVLSSGSGIFDPGVDGPGTYTYAVLNGVCGEDVAKVVVEVDNLNNAGEDRSLELCKSDNPVNLLDLLSGNPDEGGSWTLNSLEVPVIFDPSRDEAGTYTYTVANGICTSASSHITITLLDILNAGENTALTVSSSGEPVDLFASLAGNPDAGGTWTPALSGGSGMFDPAIDNEGVYTYTVGNDRCGTSSSEVTVTINLLPNAGEGGRVEICEDSAGIDLFDTLTGTPDTGGTWSPALAGGSGIFDPALDVAGTYSYSVTNDNGDRDSSEVSVTVSSLPDSGENADVEICVNAGALDLFSTLGGNPQSGGAWFPQLTSGGGIFDPSVDREGVYVYTVSNQSCGTSSSQVVVTITDFEPIDDYTVNIKEFSENNTVEVIIPSDLLYEYSLDGSNFQSSNHFVGVPGGLYTLYVREVNGCGVLQERIAVLDYPKFFTPNNDGYHDTWNLTGNSGRNLSYIKIYDRYGKLLNSIDPYGKGWDGTSNGTNMPADDYWFEVVIDQIVKTGHFSLLR